MHFQLGGSRPTGGEERKNSFDDVLASGFEKMFIIRRASARRLFSHARFALRDAAEKKSPFLDKEEVCGNITKRRDPSLAAFIALRYVNTLLGCLCFLLDSVTPR